MPRSDDLKALKVCALRATVRRVGRVLAHRRLCITHPHWPVLCPVWDELSRSPPALEPVRHRS